jgi:hypothetical protein
MIKIMFSVFSALLPLAIFATPPENTYLPTKNFQSSYPYITGDTVREYCDHILDAVESFSPGSVKDGDSIFVMIDHLDHFFKNYHPLIRGKYVLITPHFFDESDDSVPGKFRGYLDDEKILAWFSHNIDFQHKKMIYFPIGIGNAYYNYGNKDVFDFCISKYKGVLARNKLLYMNFSIHTNPKERIPVFEFFREKKFCTSAKNKSLRSYLLDLCRHKFVLSPMGNGIDCFRTWEALLMGCIPIVKSSSIDPLFVDLPVLIVDDWSMVTEEYLNKKFTEMRKKTFKMEKIYIPYWISKIQSFKE